MAGGEHLGAELGVGASADQHEIGDESDELVGECREAWRRIMPNGTGDPPARGPTAELRLDAEKDDTRTDADRVTPHLCHDGLQGRRRPACRAGWERRPVDPSPSVTGSGI